MKNKEYLTVKVECRKDNDGTVELLYIDGDKKSVFSLNPKKRHVQETNMNGVAYRAMLIALSALVPDFNWEADLGMDRSI